MFLPRGAVIAEELEKLAKETEFAAGYQRVRTPHIARESLYKKSGHLPYYAESMFPPMEIRRARRVINAQLPSLKGVLEIGEALCKNVRCKEKYVSARWRRRRLKCARVRN